MEGFGKGFFLILGGFVACISLCSLALVILAIVRMVAENPPQMLLPL